MTLPRDSPNLPPPHSVAAPFEVIPPLIPPLIGLSRTEFSLMESHLYQL